MTKQYFNIIYLFQQYLRDKQLVEKEVSRCFKYTQNKYIKCRMTCKFEQKVLFKKIPKPNKSVLEISRYIG